MIDSEKKSCPCCISAGVEFGIDVDLIQHFTEIINKSELNKSYENRSYNEPSATMMISLAVKTAGGERV